MSAMRARKPCRKQGCPALVGDEGYCEKHITTDNTHARTRRAYDLDRVGAEHRTIYSSKRWRSLRRMKLDADPFCEMKDLCVMRTGHAAPASVVDHIKSVIEHPELAYDFDNLRSCCKPCHDSRTAKEQGFARTKEQSTQA
jgi:5-methylcytosine-specific restriction enzyme A